MNARSEQGFTLVEILIALLVLSVGVLGVAAMQLTSFQTNQSAYARSQATYLAQEIFDRMRANPEGYATTTVYDAISACDAEALPADPACVDTAAGCGAQAMAQQDVREWAANFINVFDVDDYRPTLPQGCGVVTRSAGTNIFTARVSWQDRDWDGTQRELQDRFVEIEATLN